MGAEAITLDPMVVVEVKERMALATHCMVSSDLGPYSYTSMMGASSQLGKPTGRLSRKPPRITRMSQIGSTDVDSTPTLTSVS